MTRHPSVSTIRVPLCICLLTAFGCVVNVTCIPVRDEQSTSTTNETSASSRPSCMTAWLRAFDSSLTKKTKINIEKAMVVMNFRPAGETTLDVSAGQLVILYALFGSRQNTDSFLGCISGADQECASRAPCLNGGQCVLTQGISSVTTQYQCSCAPGYSGLACEREVSSCVRRPCQNGGQCQDLIPNGFRCQCALLYSGDLCQHAWFDQHKFSDVLSTLSQMAGKVERISTQFSTVVKDGWKRTNDFLKNRTDNIQTQVSRTQSQTSRDISIIKEQLTLQARNVAALSVKTDELLSFKQQAERSHRCLWDQLGYMQYTWHNAENGINNGQLRSLTFLKKQQGTGLRLLYSSNIRERHGAAKARWFFKIDGQECDLPSKIDVMMHHDKHDSLHVPAVLLGTCIATSSGQIGKGNHTISVHIESSDGHSGWWSTSFLEVKEICTQNQ